MADSTSESESSLPFTGKICTITKQFLSKFSHSSLERLQSLDLHIRDTNFGKINRIQNLHFVPNILQLNLSYNCITRIEGLTSLTHLNELNLAENAISEV